MDWLEEQLKTSRNLCDIALLLKAMGRDELLPTVLELLYIEVNNIVEEHCVKE